MSDLVGTQIVGFPTHRPICEKLIGSILVYIGSVGVGSLFQ